MRLLRKNMLRSLCILCGLASAVILTSCQLFDSHPKPPQHHPFGPGTNDVSRLDPLQIGDRIRVELSGTADTPESKEQDINADGSINLTRIGFVAASGKSASQLEKEIQAKYVPDWYPQITVTVTPVARYFFVLGQVVNSGRILYTGPITVLGAIGAAGDFTPFADKAHVKVIRADGSIETINCKRAITHPELDVPIYPHDKIQVGRRF